VAVDRDTERERAADRKRRQRERNASRVPVALCNARTRAGGTCRLAAGHGTDHVGFGRCRLHAGNTPSGRARRTVSERAGPPQIFSRARPNLLARPHVITSAERIRRGKGKSVGRRGGQRGPHSGRFAASFALRDGGRRSHRRPPVAAPPGKEGPPRCWAQADVADTDHRSGPGLAGGRVGATKTRRSEPMTPGTPAIAFTRSAGWRLTRPRPRRRNLNRAR
jgi:hypothetical protein